MIFATINLGGFLKVILTFRMQRQGKNLISSLLAELETNESCYLVCGINVVLFQHSPEAHTL